MNAAAIGAHLVGSSGLLAANAARVVAQQGVAKTVLIGAALAGPLAAPNAAKEAVAAVAHSEHTAVGPVEFRRLTAPDAHDMSAAPLLRYPELLQPIAALYHADLIDRLRLGPALAC